MKSKPKMPKKGSVISSGPINKKVDELESEQSKLRDILKKKEELDDKRFFLNVGSNVLKILFELLSYLKSND